MKPLPAVMLGMKPAVWRDRRDRRRRGRRARRRSGPPRSAARRPRCRRCRPRPGSRRPRAGAGRSGSWPRTNAGERHRQRAPGRRGAEWPKKADRPECAAAAVERRRAAALRRTRHCRATAVSPAASMLIATPETIWLPRWVMRGEAVHEREGDARPAMPASKPDQARCRRRCAAAAAAKAAASILPSSPMSTTPERSDHSPARQARSSGIDEPQGRVERARRGCRESIVSRPLAERAARDRARHERGGTARRARRRTGSRGRR